MFRSRAPEENETPIWPAHLDAPMARTRASTVIDRPPHRVWPVVADLCAIQRHHPGVREALARGPRTGLGAARDCRFKKGRVVEEAVAWDEGRSYRLKTRRVEGLPLQDGAVDVELRPEGGRTRLSLGLEWRSSGVFWPGLQGLLAKPMMARTARAIVRNVRREAESEQ